MKFTWSRDYGYECSSRGDKRFSAFYATLADGRTIEEHYQCDVKGYDPGGVNWRLGKGKPALHEGTDLWSGYLQLWRDWAEANPVAMDYLYVHAVRSGYMLRDSFATTPVNQAHALCVLLNERTE